MDEGVECSVRGQAARTGDSSLTTSRRSRPNCSAEANNAEGVSYVGGVGLQHLAPAPVRSPTWRLAPLALLPVAPRQICQWPGDGNLHPQACPASDECSLLHLPGTFLPPPSSQVPADKSASGLEVEIPTPKYVQRVHCDLDAKAAGTQSWDYGEKSHLLK